MRAATIDREERIKRGTGRRITLRISIIVKIRSVLEIPRKPGGAEAVASPKINTKNAPTPASTTSISQDIRVAESNVRL